MNTKFNQIGRFVFGIAITSFTVAMTGCGGGGSDAPGTGPAAVANAYPNVSPTVGDYWVF
jgi:hypothetical protein